MEKIIHAHGGKKTRHVGWCQAHSPAHEPLEEQRIDDDAKQPGAGKKLRLPTGKRTPGQSRQALQINPLVR